MRRWMKQVAMKKCLVEVVPTSLRSIKLTKALMRATGLWHSSSKSSGLWSNVVLALVLLLMIYSVFVQAQELIYAGSSITAITFAAPVATVVVTESSKLVVFIAKRRKMVNLNKFVDSQFWKKIYSDEELVIFNDCDRMCFRLIGIYCTLLLGTCSMYLILPIIGMDTELSPQRELPFPMRIASPLYESPYYEMYFALEIVGTLTVGLCVSTFASYQFAVNLFTAVQFKILNTHLTSLCDFEDDARDERNTERQMKALTKLKGLITTHQTLIDLTKQIEDLCCYVMLEQVFGSTSQICFCGLQILLAKSTLTRTVLSVEFLLSSVLQLYFYCYSSHMIFEASESVSQAIYSMKWFKITDPKLHKEFRQLLLIISMRARRPCVLTVGKFYPLTLAAFSSVLSTSMSYFTVLRQLLYNQ
ncbi:odorant receptor 49b-like [Phymastichus coffea]|uniref:odorant receptor 49b-like n=1 Tax=Phymastichus coffea TaxID=108790 RepID=UPI00273C75A8|nr:odorant receptor 49b-like [Phymastichus coffea]